MGAQWPAILPRNAGYEGSRPRRRNETSGSRHPGPDDPWLDAGSGLLEKGIAAPSTKRLIHGLASSSTINAHHYSLISRGMEATLPVPILSAHAKHGEPIGDVFLVRKSANRVYVRAALRDNEAADYARGLIESGETLCFSGAAAAKNLKLQAIVDKKTFYSEWQLGEVSICRKGANPDSIFEIWDGKDDGQKFFNMPARTVEVKLTPVAGARKSETHDGPPTSANHWRKLTEKTVVTKHDADGRILEFERHSVLGKGQIGIGK